MEPVQRSKKEVEDKVLGVNLNKEEDRLVYDFRYCEKSRKEQKIWRLQKRNLMSNVAGMFEPLGLVSTTTVTATILLQDLGKMKVQRKK